MEEQLRLSLQGVSNATTLGMHTYLAYVFKTLMSNNKKENYACRKKEHTRAHFESLARIMAAGSALDSGFQFVG
jgi:hypothetical protein